MKKFLAPVGLMIALLTSASVQAQTNVSVVADGTLAQDVVSGGGNTGDRHLGIGGGLLIESRASQNFSLEFGGLYHVRKFGDGNFSTNYTYAQVPVLMRLYLSNYISLGAGGFFQYGFGDAFDGSDSSKTDFGALGSLGIYIPVGASTAVVIDLRYNYGLKDLSDGPLDVKTRDFQILAGLRF